MTKAVKKRNIHVRGVKGKTVKTKALFPLLAIGAASPYFYGGYGYPGYGYYGYPGAYGYGYPGYFW